MVGVEAFERPDVARSLRAGRLVLAVSWGGDFATPGLVFLFVALLPGVLDLSLFSSGTVWLAFLLLPVPLAGLGLAYRLMRAAARSRDLIRIDAGTETRTAREVFTAAVEALGWEKDRNNADFSRYFFGRCVATVLFRRDHILFNCRRQISNELRWPMNANERDEAVRSVCEAMERRQSVERTDDAL